MFLRLLLLLTLVPIAEIYFLLQISDVFGGRVTLAIILATGLLGAWLLRNQGASVFNDLQSNAASGRLPTDALARALMTFIGGLFLLTPGLITDAIGLSLIFPLTQKVWQRTFKTAWKNGVKSGNVRVHTYGTGFGTAPPSQKNGQYQEPVFNSHNDVIDVSPKTTETIQIEK